MHAGFAMLETGCCRSKNASNVLMKNLVNVCVGTLGWWILGWAFAYGAGINRFIGTTGFLGEGFYTKDAAGTIIPLSCANNACQSTMLSWFFQWLAWLREELSNIFKHFACIVSSKAWHFVCWRRKVGLLHSWSHDSQWSRG